MALPIEEYALIGDTHTAALIGSDGSINWAPFPRFDSGACFAALLGTPENGRWRVAPCDPQATCRRRYLPGTLVLETLFETARGKVRVVDFMPVRDGAPNIVRLIEGVEGNVEMQVELVMRFDYGRTVPWVRKQDHTLTAIAGPDGICVRGDVTLRGEGLTSTGKFSLRPGERRAMVLTWFPSHHELPGTIDPLQALAVTETWWREWSERCRYQGPRREAVLTSLRVLKALTYEPTGGIVAAPTASLPEWCGGSRNWDYRFCWLRDATLTLNALMLGGYIEEAQRWREWLLRAVAGDPARLQILYGLAGERRLVELELPWLDGYQGSKPVRIGNAAHEQLQLDVYGEVMDAMFQARRFGLGASQWGWDLEVHLLESLKTLWRQPDEGIWEVRGPRRHFVHSKMMAWVAFDRGIKSAEQFQLKGPLDEWRRIRDEIHAEVCARGFDEKRQTFTQTYERPDLDAALLMMPLVGFLPASDPRVSGTVRAIEGELLHDGFVRRYRTETAKDVDGQNSPEGVFLPCSFWLADVYVQLGRRADAERLFNRLVDLSNDVGLLSEEYDPVGRRLLGNFPQAFSHLALVTTAVNLSPDAHRSEAHRGQCEAKATPDA